jgi:hypothetical protein
LTKNNFGNEDVGRIILKYKHKTLLGDLNDETYANKKWRFVKTKFNSGPNILYSEMTTVASNKLDTESTCFKRSR